MSEESITTMNSVNWRGPRGVAEETCKFWSRGLDRHFLGEYSFAVIKGNINEKIEDYSEVVVGSESTFIGVYDGHDGHQSAEFLSNNMFNNLMSCVKEDEFLDPVGLAKAFIRTKDGWEAELEKKSEELIAENKSDEELIAAFNSGSSCLIGVIWSEYLCIVANVGDTRAVMGWQKEDSELDFKQLTRDDNVRDPAMVNPGDVEALEASDGEKFIVLASSGFWKLLDSEEAAAKVLESPRKGIAERLIEDALVKSGSSYDDMSVIVVFFDRNLDVTNIPVQVAVKVGGSNSFRF